HRIGRTGRAEREGDAFTMITPDDDATVRALERAVGQRIPRQTIAGFDYDAPPPAVTPQQPRGRQPMPPARQPQRQATHATPPARRGGRPQPTTRPQRRDRGSAG